MRPYISCSIISRRNFGLKMMHENADVEVYGEYLQGPAENIIGWAYINESVFTY